MMMRKTLITIFIMLCSVGSFGQSAERFFDAKSKLSNAQLCDTLLKQAAVNIEKQQWDYAIEKYGKVLEIDDKNLAARYFRAYAHTKLHHYDWAKSDYENVLKIVPKHLETQLGLAYVYEKMGKKRDAFDMYNRVVQQFPDSASAYAARAIYEQANNMAEVALYDWEQAISRNPSDTGYMISRVELLITLGRKDEAREALDDMQQHGVTKGELLKWYKKVKK
ncbi:MAG: tetratricopeptide repeat protein [Prevotella sp.]|nr:tetratricopeptide repeat protein [Prevotella sp.]